MGTVTTPMRRVSVRTFKAMPLGTPADEPLEVTSHGFVVGTWYPAGSEEFAEWARPTDLPYGCVTWVTAAEKEEPDAVKR